MSAASACSSSACTHLDLFSGIGGFALAAKRCGLETKAFVEIDTFCQRVLQKNFPGVPIHEDITDYQPPGPGYYDLVTAGYPCQPYSHAGKRRGAEDDRALWTEVKRIVESSRPAWFLGENVAGHINLGLDEVLSDLAAIGYTWEAFVIPACAVDAQHRRDRVWIVAYAENNRTGRREQQPQGSEKTGYVAYANQQGPQRHGGLHECTSELTAWQSRRSVEGCWEPEPAVGRVANGVPRRVDRLRGLGNAIVPQVAEVIIGAMFNDRA